ncbi:hypothetical protein ACIGO9_29690 [Nocardia asteroides]|uniref:hypothetical protein n=1 Tax=Nocardia asteroides TaxID=1824 RepID=UPI0037C8D0B6
MTTPQHRRTTESGSGRTELAADHALRRAYEALTTAHLLTTTSSGEDIAQLLGEQFDIVFAGMDRLIELRRRDLLRTAARFGVAAPSAPVGPTARH